MENKQLRNRPFLIVRTINRPADGVNTSVNGWSKITGSWATYERIKIADRVSSKDECEATVIIDILTGKTVKSRFTEHPEEQIVEHFLNQYKDECKRAIDVWLSKQAQNFLTPEKLAAEMAAQAEQPLDPAPATEDQAAASQ